MPCRNLVIPWALVLTMACASSPTGTTEPEPKLSQPTAVDQVIDQYVHSGAYPFIYVLLENQAGEVVYEHAAVNEELLPDRAIDGQQWIRIWSMSKIVTISIVLDLVEEGILNLDDLVTRFIPEFDELEVAVSPNGNSLLSVHDSAVGCPYGRVPARAPMTVRQLINHQAGFYYANVSLDCLGQALAEQDITQARDSQELIDRLAKLPLMMQPGEGEHYGLNTTVLGLVAERATGKSLQQLVFERVSRPLAIQGLRYGLPAGESLLPRFSGRDGALREAHPGELDIMGPHVPDYDPGHLLYLGGEGMLATTDGYADFLRMLLGQGTLNGYRFLNEDTIAEMTAPHTELDNEFGYNGYNLWVNNGLQADGSQGEGGLWIGGGYEGTHFWIDPKRGFVGLIMSQMFWIPESGYHRDEHIRAAIYAQLVGD